MVRKQPGRWDPRTDPLQKLLLLPLQILFLRIHVLLAKVFVTGYDGFDDAFGGGFATLVQTFHLFDLLGGEFLAEVVVEDLFIGVHAFFFCGQGGAEHGVRVDILWSDRADLGTGKELIVQVGLKAHQEVSINLAIPAQIDYTTKI